MISCKYIIQCQKFLHPNDVENVIREGWAGTKIAEKYAIVNMEENMGKIKEQALGPDGLPIDNEIMTEQEVEEAMAEIMEEVDQLKKNELKFEKRSSFIHGFFAGWGFIVLLNLIDYFL